MKKLLANQFKNDYEYEQAKKRIKKGAVEARNKRLQRDYDVAVIVTGKHIPDRKSTRLNSSHSAKSRMPSSA